MQNTGCTNAQLVSALNSNDQGTHNVLNGKPSPCLLYLPPLYVSLLLGTLANNDTGLFTLPTHIIAAAFGNNAAADLAKLKAGVPDVGTGSVVGDDDCRRRCGLV